MPIWSPATDGMAMPPSWSRVSVSVGTMRSTTASMRFSATSPFRSGQSEVTKSITTTGVPMPNSICSLMMSSSASERIVTASCIISPYCPPGSPQTFTIMSPMANSSSPALPAEGPTTGGRSGIVSNSMVEIGRMSPTDERSKPSSELLMERSMTPACHTACRS